MPGDFRTELTLPADERIQALVKNYGHSLADLADIPEDQSELLVMENKGLKKRVRRK